MVHRFSHCSPAHTTRPERPLCGKDAPLTVHEIGTVGLAIESSAAVEMRKGDVEAAFEALMDKHKAHGVCFVRSERGKTLAEMERMEGPVLRMVGGMPKGIFREVRLSTYSTMVQSLRRLLC